MKNVDTVVFNYKTKRGSHVNVKYWFEGRVVLCDLTIKRWDGASFWRRGWARCTQEDMYFTRVGMEKAALSALSQFTTDTKDEFLLVLLKVCNEMGKQGFEVKAEREDFHRWLKSSDMSNIL